MRLAPVEEAAPAEEAAAGRGAARGAAPVEEAVIGRAGLRTRLSTGRSSDPGSCQRPDAPAADDARGCHPMSLRQCSGVARPQESGTCVLHGRHDADNNSPPVEEFVPGIKVEAPIPTAPPSRGLSSASTTNYAVQMEKKDGTWKTLDAEVGDAAAPSATTRRPSTASSPARSTRSASSPRRPRRSPRLRPRTPSRPARPAAERLRGPATAGPAEPAPLLLWRSQLTPTRVCSPSTSRRAPP